MEEIILEHLLSLSADSATEAASVAYGAEQEEMATLLVELALEDGTMTVDEMLADPEFVKLLEESGISQDEFREIANKKGLA